MEIALIGNPNCGKSTLFNELTGANRSIGNWPGVTVTIESGKCRYEDVENKTTRTFTLVDLPGIYSLHHDSPEQKVVEEYLANASVDLIINIVDATNLERNLYLTYELRALGIPMVLALNIWDELSLQGLRVDPRQLGELLGCPAIPISAIRREGFQRLLAQAVSQAAIKPQPSSTFSQEETQKLVKEVVAQVVTKEAPNQSKLITQRIDRILCHPIWATPIFIIIMAAVFYVAFGGPGNWLHSLFDHFFGEYLPQVFDRFLLSIGASGMIRSLLVDGLFAGMASVLVFLPQLAVMFFFLTILEYSGYMSRAAYLTDRLLARFKLSGMAFIPMMLGFGCSVPALTSCRGLASDREKRILLLVIPFISCGARMPLYILITGIFFPQQAGLVIILLYLLGILVALCTAAVIGKITYRGETPSFILEMPPYRRPAWRGIWRSVKLRLWDFISRAGTVILLASVVIWFLSNFNLRLQYLGSEDGSLIYALGSCLAPLFRPLGFGYWQLAVALLSGIMAKEATVAALTVLLGTASGLGVAAGLQSLLSPAAAMAFLVFYLLYIPCMASIATVRRESASWKFTLFSVLYSFVLAWLLAWLVYGIGCLLF